MTCSKPPDNLGTNHSLLGFHVFFWKTRVGLLNTLEGPFQVEHCVIVPTALRSLKETSGPGRGQEPKTLSYAR